MFSIAGALILPAEGIASLSGCMDPTGKMIVTVGNAKGGTGKTTFAVQIALERQAAGRIVLLVDADRQASAQKVMTMRVQTATSSSPASSWPTGVSCVPSLPAGRPAPRHGDRRRRA